MQVNSVSNTNNHVNFNARVEVKLGEKLINYLKGVKTGFPDCCAENADRIIKTVKFIQKAAPQVGTKNDVITLNSEIKGLLYGSIDVSYNGVNITYISPPYYIAVENLGYEFQSLNKNIDLSRLLRAFKYNPSPILCLDLSRFKSNPTLAQGSSNNLMTIERSDIVIKNKFKIINNQLVNTKTKVVNVDDLIEKVRKLNTVA